MIAQVSRAPFPTDHTHPLLDVRGLGVQYGETLALEGASFCLCPGEFVAVIGPNGAGKSTLMKTILGLNPHQSGTIRFAIELGKHPTRAISYVPQQQTLEWSFPVSVFDLVMMGRVGRLGWFRYPGASDRRIVRESLEATGTLNLASRPIAALSGGQKQRVLLARMLARESRLLFLDEPLTGVDTVTQESIFEVLERERSRGKALLMVTHDLEAAAKWCSSLILLNRTVIASGPPAVVYTPQNIERTFSSSHIGHTHVSA